MNKTELQKVAAQLKLPEGWEVKEIMPRGGKNDNPTETILVQFYTGRGNNYNDKALEDFWVKAHKVVNQLNKLTAKTADGVWRVCDSGWENKKSNYFTVNFFIDFAYICKRRGKNWKYKAIPLGKKFFKDKYLTKAQVKKAINKYFDEGKLEAVADLVRNDKVSQVEFEEIRFTWN